MKMRVNLLLTTTMLTAIVLTTCLFSEYSWIAKSSGQDSLRQLVGLPSIAVGNLSPAARNPALEIMCSGLGDTPGGYCNYFTSGSPYGEAVQVSNITVSIQP